VSTRTALAVGLIATLAAGPAPGQTALAWRLKEKDRFWAEWTCLDLQRTDVNGQRGEGMEETTVVSRFTVLEENPDRSVVLEQQIELVKSRALGKAPNVVGLKLEGAVVRLTLDEKMAVRKVEGLEDVAGRLAGPAAPGPQVKAVAQALENQLRLWLDSTFYRLPGREVAPGATWQQVTVRAMGDGTPGTHTRTFTLRGPETVEGRKLLRIDVKTTTTLAPRQEEPTILFRKPQMEIASEDNRGTLYYDPVAGRPALVRVRLEVDLAGSGVARGEPLEVKGKTHWAATLRLLDADPLVAAPRPARDPAPEPAAGKAPAAKEVVNSLGMKLMHIPAGRFTMGAPAGQPQRTEFEEEHEVRITRAFYMGAHEVTVGQFRAFVKATGYKTAAEKSDKGCFGYNQKADRMEPGRYSWKDPGWDQTDDHPAVNLSWHDAKAFCAWLSKKEGRTYRLPTEAEWEYACRAGTTTRYWSGDDAETLVKAGNVVDASARKKFPQWQAIQGDDGWTFTAPVGTFKPNAWGLYDMHGNALEWCEDWFWYYDARAAKDPQGPPFGVTRVQRGGSWADFPYQCTSSRRTGFPPDHYCVSSGFRVVMPADERDAAPEPTRAVRSAP
jgi:formylglycine-generating enzyme required for sulfatase activity